MPSLAVVVCFLSLGLQSLGTAPVATDSSEESPLDTRAILARLRSLEDAQLCDDGSSCTMLPRT